MPSHNSRLPNTVIAESGADVLLLRQTDAAARIRFYWVSTILIGLLFLACGYSCLTHRQQDVFCFLVLGGGWLFFLSGYALERELFQFDKDGIIITHRSPFRRVRKRYRRTGIIGLASERVGSGHARGIALYDSGLALALCYGEEEALRDILGRIRTLWSLPAPEFLFLNDPRRADIADYALQSTRRPLNSDERWEEMPSRRGAEQLSWTAQGREKQWACRKRLTDLFAPTAHDDGAFTLPAYPHSLWNRDAQQVRFYTLGKPETVVPFADIAEIFVRSLERFGTIDPPLKL